MCGIKIMLVISFLRLLNGVQWYHLLGPLRPERDLYLSSQILFFSSRYRSPFDQIQFCHVCVHVTFPRAKTTTFLSSSEGLDASGTEFYMIGFVYFLLLSRNIM